MAADGRQYSVVTGSYLASEFSGSNSAANLKDSTSGSVPIADRRDNWERSLTKKAEDAEADIHYALAIFSLKLGLWNANGVVHLLQTPQSRIQSKIPVKTLSLITIAF